MVFMLGNFEVKIFSAPFLIMFSMFGIHVEFEVKILTF